MTIENAAAGDIERILSRWSVAQYFQDARTPVSTDSSRFLTRYEAILRSGVSVAPPSFDEVFYLAANPDVLEAALRGDVKCGLHHFVGWGFFEGRPPNAQFYQRLRGLPLTNAAPPAGFDTRLYLQMHPDVAAFITDFDGLFSVEAFARKFGVRMGHFPGILPTSPLASPSAAMTAAQKEARVDLLREYFDPAYYREQHPEVRPGREFRHYLVEGRANGYAPNASFDEQFYRAFYQDVAEAIAAGFLSCGYEHYLLSGADEGRIPRFDPPRCLEAVYPGVTKPTALGTIGIVARKFEHCPFEVTDRGEPTIWVMLPFLNADLMFGGFASLLEFLEQMLAREVRLGIFLSESQLTQIEFYKFRAKRSSRFLSALDSMPKFSALSGEPFVFSRNDLFVSYSVWEGLWARTFASQTRWKRPVYWIQEYEPVFHAHNSFHFLSNSAYHYDHVGVFNSDFLRQWFIERRIGIYGDPRRIRAVSYEHLLWRPPASRDRDQDPPGRRRVLFLYARPEDHAARNLMPIAVFALKMAIAEGVFQGDWDFIGLGALAGPYSIDLGHGAHLDVRARLPAEEYSQFISTVDIGLSLMYAPHPSLLPYELAMAGAMVVTNEFESRDGTYIRNRDPRIIEFQPYLEDCVRALKEAVARLMSGCVPTPTTPSEAGQRFLDSSQAQWSDIFDDSFFDRLATLIDPGFRWNEFASRRTTLTCVKSKPPKARRRLTAVPDR